MPHNNSCSLDQGKSSQPVVSAIDGFFKTWQVWRGNIDQSLAKHQAKMMLLIGRKGQCCLGMLVLQAVLLQSCTWGRSHVGEPLAVELFAAQ